MSSSNKTLQVTAADAGAEITVVDGKLNRVARGVGALRQELPEGIYEVRVRTGPKREERLVSLDRDRVVTFEAQRFPSPAPLDGTSRSHEYHQQAAVEASGTRRDTLGTGASVLVFARIWTADKQGTLDNPGAGLSFLNWSGDINIDIATRADVRDRSNPNTSNYVDPSAGWCADITPGGYRLRLTRHDGATIERAIHCSPNQQTQIFLLDARYPDDSGSRGGGLDLQGGTISIGPSQRFDPNDRSARLAEFAKYALTQRHRFLSGSVLDELLEHKYEDPVLGLLGAHLLLRDKPRDTHLFMRVTDNLVRLLGPQHPDVQALCLRRADRERIGNLQVLFPPMLRPSWDLIVQESFKKPDLLPPESPSSRIAAHILSASTWLVWDAAAGVEVGEDLTVLTNTLKDYIGARSRAENRKIREAHPRLNRLRGFAPQLLGSLSYFMGPMLGESTTPAAEKLKLTAEEKADLGQHLGVPSQVLEEKLDKLF